MVTPGSAIDPRLNATSAQLAQLEQAECEHKTKVATIDKVLRESVSFAADIAMCQLGLLNDLLEQPVEKRNFALMPQKVREKFKQIFDDNMADYHSLLKARDWIMENGREVLLTDEKRERLESNFANILGETLRKFEPELQVDPQTDLEALKKTFKERVKLKIDVAEQMLDSKTTLTKRAEAVHAQSYPLIELRSQLLTSPPTNMWVASQTGALDFIRKKINDLWFWQVKDCTNEKDKEGFTPLHHAAFHRQLETLRVLLDNKADPSVPDAQGYLPLHWAAKVGDVPCASLLARGVSLEARGGKGALGEEYGRTPLHMAAFNGRLEMVQHLLESGAEINAKTYKADNSKTPLHDAVVHQDIPVILALCKSQKLNVNLTDARDWSPLCYSIADGNVDIVALVIGHESWKPVQDPTDPNHPDQLIALAEKHPLVKKFLVDFFQKR